MNQDHASIYRKLGVEPIVNCGSSRSVYGNSTMSDPVRAAMESASFNHVIMSELGEAAGARLAELTGAEWGLVTAGSATGLALGTAACAAANDPLRMLQLPEQFSAKRRAVLAPAGQRFAYDHAVRMVGAKVIEVDNVAALKSGFAQYDVVAILLLAERDESAPLTFDQMLPEARSAGVPIIVDAASEALGSPEMWTARGADLVVYSVSKLMRGPAASGILLGRKPLVQAAWYNGPPHQSFGRVMKISKEQIVGAIAAVERWFENDHKAERDEWKRHLDLIHDRLQPINTLKLDWHVLSGGIRRLEVDWSDCQPDLDFVDLQTELLARRPRVLIDDFGGTARSTMINPFALDDDGAGLVAEALYEALTAARPAPSDGRNIEIDISGAWVVEIDFATGPAQHTLELKREGDTLTGSHETPFGNGEGTGTMTARGFNLQTLQIVEGLTVSFRFVAETCTADRIAGYVEIGAATGHALGPTTLRQFGRLAFEGRRQ